MSQSKRLAFLFPGQGAQYPGMGKDFFQQFPLVKETFEEADDLLGYKLSQILLEGPEVTLTETRHSQTAIFVVSVAMYRVLEKLFPSIRPSICAGLSLGEYTALHVAQKIPFDRCLSIVQHRGRYMNEACLAHPGTMAVILGLDGEAVENLVKKVNLPKDLWVANFNCPGQVVISGTLKGIEVGTSAAKAHGAKRVLPLQVHGAFHSGLMQEAQEHLAPHIQEAPLKESSTALVMNVSGDFVADLSAIRHHLIQQVTHSVRWEQGIRSMEKQGIDCYVEIGCGKALSGFNKRIGVKAPTISIEHVTDLDLLARELT
jgi:[acyl-carrier-protein] S-malonyltransferase